MDAVAALWPKVKATMLERVTVIENATLALIEGVLTDADRREAEREAHKMAGAIGTFGFTAGSSTARKIELLLGGPTKLNEADALRLADLVVELRCQLDAEPADQRSEATSSERAADPDASLLVISADAELINGLEAEAAMRGLHLRVVVAVSEIVPEHAGRFSYPSVVLLDLETASDPDPIAVVTELLPGVPILAVTDRYSFDDRVKVAREGARYLLPKPQSSRRLLDAALQTFLAQQATTATALVVDDDPELLMLLDTILTPAGLTLTLVDTPRFFWNALEETQPDLVILDLDMPEVDGLDLCRMLRNDPRREGIPVLILTVRTEPDVIQKIFSAGADDYVSKPVVGPELLTRISNRIERTQLRREMIETDPLTGLANRHKAKLAFDQFFRIAARQSVPVALVVLDIDRFRRISELHGNATADQVLSHLAHLMVQRFRGHDVASRWDGERFVVGMFGASRDIAVMRLTQILQTFQSEEFVDSDGSLFNASFSAGIAAFPSDGTDLHSLYHAADEALSLAKAAGTAKVIPSGWVGEPQLVDHTIDVALVEDDTALASLLLHALENRGYHTEWYQDGEEAVQMLAGSQLRVQAQVILLDVGLPSLDGFDVLRRLIDSGVTQRTRVIMLTAHASEPEVLEALELGAFDHVAKPFSTPVLLQRIRRAMRS